MQTESSFERRGRGSRPPFRRRRKNRHPGLAERDAPLVVPKPKGELPAAFASNVFGLVDPLIQHAVADEKYDTPTPIQEQAIPPLLEGRDLLGCAQTGTGKTAAFLLPILHKLHNEPKEVEAGHPRALILAPTRELAAQIATSVATYGRYLGLPFAVVFGGVSQFPQVQALRHKAALVVATPGRLLDLMNQRHLALDCIEEFVLDEADRMLDMGFLPDIRKILAKLPQERHTQFFSATLSKEVLRLAKDMVSDPVEVTIEPDKPTVDKIHQVLMFVDKPRKDALLSHLLSTREEMSRVIVFARTRHGSDKIVRKLDSAGIPADAIHSDKTQRARTEALNAFKRGRVRALVATDIASRGIDVDDITHVVNFDLPEETESYIHRIGRTARAGASGCSISFVSAEERGLLRAVERMIKKSIDVERVDEFHSERAEKAAGRKAKSGDDDAPLPPPPWAARKAQMGANREERRESKFRERPPKGSNLGRRQTDFRQRMMDEMQISDEPQGRKPRRPDRPPRDDEQGRADEPPRRERDDRPPRREDRPPRYSDKPPRREDRPPRREDRSPRYSDKPPRYADEKPPRRSERFERDWREEGSKRPYKRDDARGYEPRRRADDERPGRSRDFQGKRDYERPPRFDEGRRYGDGRRDGEERRGGGGGGEYRPKRPYHGDEPPRRDDRRFGDERPDRPPKFQKGKFDKKPGFRGGKGDARKPSNAPHPFARFQKKKKR
ncbi:MAG: DEAD/DEAH box helicase [Kiritimatiellaeota bacterium]|nr:DEAD/DEAH box helicase [Kiritimatiellota bacterium]